MNLRNKMKPPKFINRNQKKMTEVEITKTFSDLNLKQDKAEEKTLEHSYPLIPNLKRLVDNTLFTHYFCEAYSFVTKIQSAEELPTANVFLSFYPIAKNIRFCASYMSQNIMQYKRSKIAEEGRPGESLFWEKSMRMGRWSPWLWARTMLPSDYTNTQGWNHYFESFQQDHFPPSNSINIDTEIACSIPKNVKLFFITLACHLYTFNLNNNYKLMMNEYRIAMKWPKNANILAIQIRRGDSCTMDGSTSTRPFYSLDQYLEKADILISNCQFTHIFISTDSDAEIEHIHLKRPEWKLLYLPFDRSQFMRLDKTKPEEVEKDCAKFPEKIPFIMKSAIADLFFISQCQGYVSTITSSEFSRCGWFLQMAVQQKMTPFINMNCEVIDLSVKDALLLL